jgi:hypothetical protein
MVAGHDGGFPAPNFLQSTAASASAASSLKGGSSNATSLVATTLAEEMDKVLVPIEDWMEAPEGMRIYGSEKFVIGPL